MKLPSFYAFFLGVFLNKMDVNLGEIFNQTATKFVGAYSVLGMMIIGMALINIKKREIEFKFISMTFLTKFLVWPLIILGIISLDKNYTQFFASNIYDIMLLMSIVPLGANTVAFATQLRTEPGKAAVAVLLSTLFALFYIPLIVSNFIQ